MLRCKINNRSSKARKDTKRIMLHNMHAHMFAIAAVTLSKTAN